MSFRHAAAVSLLAFLAGPQDRALRRPEPPRERPALPPVQEPFRTPVEREDLIQEFTAPSPLEGFYRLRRYVRPGMPPAKSEGYLAIGRRHLSLHLYGGTRNPRVPAIQAGFRQYTVRGDELLMTTLLGVRNRPSGDVVIEKRGRVERRRFELLGSRLRVHKGKAYYEFVRIE